LKAAGKVLDSTGFQPFIEPRLRKIIAKSTAANPNERYPSALDMRRALERLKLPGYWDVDGVQVPFGICGNQKFTFSLNTRSSGTAEMVAYREYCDSGRRVRISAYCHKALSSAQARARVRKLMLDVVRGRA
jgi:hypothetical protein